MRFEKRQLKRLKEYVERPEHFQNRKEEMLLLSDDLKSYESRKAGEVGNLRSEIISLKTKLKKINNLSKHDDYEDEE